MCYLLLSTQNIHILLLLWYILGSNDLAKVARYDIQLFSRESPKSCRGVKFAISVANVHDIGQFGDNLWQIVGDNLWPLWCWCCFFKPSLHDIGLCDPRAKTHDLAAKNEKQYVLFTTPLSFHSIYIYIYLCMCVCMPPTSLIWVWHGVFGPQRQLHTQMNLPENWFWPAMRRISGYNHRARLTSSVVFRGQVPTIKSCEILGLLPLICSKLGPGFDLHQINPGLTSIPKTRSKMNQTAHVL